jgi:cAMP phosphodiesterase
VAVNHKVPSVGFVFSDSKTSVAISGDTAEMDDFWRVVNKEKSLDALLVECSFPEKLDEIAHSSHHLTAKRLKKELKKLKHKDCPIFAINLKPAYFQQVAKEIEELEIERLQILQVGKVYDF